MFPCKNGHIVMSVNNDAFWASLAETMGNPDWAKTEMCQDRSSRTANWRKIEPKIIEWTRQHTTEEIKQLEDGAGHLLRA